MKATLKGQAAFLVLQIRIAKILMPQFLYFSARATPFFHQSVQ